MFNKKIKSCLSLSQSASTFNVRKGPVMSVLSGRDFKHVNIFERSSLSVQQEALRSGRNSCGLISNFLADLLPLVSSGPEPQQDKDSGK